MRHIATIKTVSCHEQEDGIVEDFHNALEQAITAALFDFIYGRKS